MGGETERGTGITWVERVTEDEKAQMAGVRDRGWTEAGRTAGKMRVREKEKER